MSRETASKGRIANAGLYIDILDRSLIAPGRTIPDGLRSAVSSISHLVGDRTITDKLLPR